MDNSFTMEVLPDGRIKFVSEGHFSQEHHLSAEEALAHAKELAGGPCETIKNKKVHQHVHQHQHHKH